MSEWREVNLDEIVKFQRGHDLTIANIKDGNYPVAGSNGVIGYHNQFTTKAPGITLGRSGNSIGIAHYYDRNFWAHNTTLYTTEFISSWPKYVYYFLRNTDLSVLNSGSAVPSLNRNHLNGIRIKVPDLPEQKAIASVLSSLDDKIDLLHRQNKTLEAMAETLFRQWFVEEAQDDWEVKKLGELVNVIDNRGKTPPYFDIPTPYPIIEVNALTGKNRLVDYSAIRKYVSDDTFKTWFRGHPKKFDSLISTVGSIGEIAMFLIEKGCIAQNVIALSAINISPIYLFEFLKYSKEEIQELDIGSVQPSIKVPHLLSIRVAIPPVKKLELFDIEVKKFLEKITLNQNQISTLESLRDTLLPKLMSGEVRVAV